MPALALSALVLLASTAQPASSQKFARGVARFEDLHQGARLVRARHGGLEHASGFAARRLAAGDEQNARLFLVNEGASFGIGNERELETVRVIGSPNRGGVAIFRRLVDDLPVFGGEVVVTWRHDGAITAVSGSRVLADRSPALFAIGGAEASRAALFAHGQGFPTGTEAERQGWLEFGGRLLPVWRVYYETISPRGAFTAFIDGETGRFLYRVSRRHDAAMVRTYPNSPLEPDASAPILLQSIGLETGTAVLRSDRVEVFNCLGLDESNASPASCSQVAAPDSEGNFVATPDLAFVDYEDAFAEQSAYFHTDAHSRFLDSLDPALAAERGGSIVGFVDAFVNVTSGDAPYDNAYYQPPSPTSPEGNPGILVCGQGTLVDFAYDGEIIFHELSHRAVEVTANFESAPDQFGFDQDPGSLNEGTADTLSFLNPASHDSCIAKYTGAAFGLTCLREADNRKTCRGNGPNDGSNPGRDGETHDDGEIWLGFTWAVWSAAHEQGLEKPMSIALFRALESMGSRPSFEAYAQSVRQAALDVFSAEPYSNPEAAQTAADFVECTIAERDLAGCSDRSVPLFSGERAQGLITWFTTGQNPAPQQYFIDVPCDATGLHVSWGTDAGPGTLYVRYGEPITFLLPGAGPQFDWVLESSEADAVLSTSAPFCAACSACQGRQTPFGPGRWYFLPAGSPSSIFTVGISLDMPEGTQAPARSPYPFGDGVHNVCAWGAGAEPSNRVLPISAEPPSLACEPPQPPGSLPSDCPPSGPSAFLSGDGRGCTCGATPADVSLLAGLCLLALRRRRSARSA